MCQILFSESANPPRSAIFDSNAQNKDGFGYAWADGGTVHFRKGYVADELTSTVVDHYLAQPFPKAIHFRLATHGGVNPQLTHPFPIKRGVPHELKGTAKSVLFHNGIWGSYDDLLRDAVVAGTLNPNAIKGLMSDSRAMAILVQRFGPDFLDLLSLGGNKVLVLKHDGWAAHGSWTEKEGWSASNSKIFLQQSSDLLPRRDKDGRFERKGVLIDQSGLPLYNRHGNPRGRRRVDWEPRDMGKASGKMDDEGQLPILERTDKPSKDSAYLSLSREQIEDLARSWDQRARLVN